MLLRYNTEKLKRILNDFHVLTGISVSILDVDFNHLAGGSESSNKFCALVQSVEEGRQRCRTSDCELLNLAKQEKRAVTRKCHAGLVDTVVPIYDSGSLLGFVIFGQIAEGEGAKIPFFDVYKRIDDLGIDRDKLCEAYENFVLPDSKKVQSAIEIITVLTKYILLEHMIEPEYDADAVEIVKYIDENFDGEISVTDICRRFSISKNILYRIIRERCGCSVKEYVTAKRMERAELLLKTTQHPISKISEMCGVGNCQNFCRIFKSRMGDTPLQYRKRWETEQTRKLFSDNGQ